MDKKLWTTDSLLGRVARRSTLESASRRIAAWRREGVVVQQPGALLVPDLKVLEALAELG